jgi:MFS family permease
MSGNDPQSPEVCESKASYYGWRVVLASSLGVMVGFGSLFVFTFSLFVKPLAADFGWTREAVSRGFAIAALTVAACSPLLGRWLDRYGPRRVVFPCIVIFGLSIASLAFLRSHLWQFYGVCLVLGAVGNGTAQMGYARAVSSWFSKRLGMALALVMAGTGVGAVVLPFLAQTLIAGPGWRVAYLTLGALVLVLGLPLTWRYLRERDRREDHPSVATKSSKTWQQGLRSLPFWIIVVVLFVGSVTMNGAVTQMVALLTDRGLSGRTAALCASILGASSLGSRLFVGWLLDRFSGPRVAFLVTVMAAAGVLLLARLMTFPMACLAAALIGVGLGAEADITPYLLTRYYGLASFSTLYGFTWTFYAVAGATGPVILGRAYDVTGSYTSLLTVLALVMAMAAGLMLLLPRYPAPTGDPIEPDSCAILSETQQN